MSSAVAADRDRVRPLLTIAFVLLLVILFAGGAWLLGPGHLRIDTRLADLAPQPANAAAQEHLINRARDSASGRITVHIESADTDRLDAAEQAVLSAIAAIDGLDVADDSARINRVVERLAPHRFSLLSSVDRRLLADGDDDVIVDEALSDLYSPSVAPRPLDLVQDPTNVLGRWLLGFADESGAASAEMPSLRIEALVDPSVGNSDAVVSMWLTELQTIRDSFADVTLLQTGVPLFAQEAAERSRRDIDRITIGSLIGLALLLVPVFRSIWPLLVPALSIAVGAATGFLLVALVQPSVHVLTLVFGASLVGIVIDYSIHGYVHLRAHAGARDAQRGLFRALTLSLITSVVGYGALGLSGVPAMASVALFSVGGLVGAWLTVVVLLPLTTRKAGDLHASLIDAMAKGLTRIGAWLSPQGRVFWVFLILSIATATLLTRSDDDPRQLIDLSPELLEQTEQIAKHWPDRRSTELLVVSAPSQDALHQRLDAAEAVAGSGQLLSISDWLPSPGEQRDSRALAQGFLDDDGVAAQILDAVGEPDTPSRLADLRAVLDKDSAQPLDPLAWFDDASLGLPPLLGMQDGEWVALAFADGDIDSEALRAYATTKPDVRVVDAVSDAKAALAAQRRASSVTVLLALAGIALFVLLAYRQWSAVKLVAIPAVSVIATVAVLAAAGVPLTFFHAIALFLVVGLGMDYAIFLRELDHKASGTTRLAIVLSAATSLLSFGLLATSSIPVARFFGQTVFIGNALNLVLAFAILTSGRLQHPAKAA